MFNLPYKYYSEYFWCWGWQCSIIIHNNYRILSALSCSNHQFTFLAEFLIFIFREFTLIFPKWYKYFLQQQVPITISSLSNRSKMSLSIIEIVWTRYKEVKGKLNQSVILTSLGRLKPFIVLNCMYRIKKEWSAWWYRR